MMLKKLTIILCATVLLGACTKKPEDAGMVTTESDMTVSQRDDVTGMEDYDQEPQGPQPGTQQDLVVNVGDRVFYGYDQHTLTSEARETVERQAAWLKKHPNLRVTIEGHADERGTREYNLALGERRAQAVRNHLTALGIDESRVNTISYGKERPAVTGSNSSAWAQNRRAVTVIE
ncbi:MAG: peptidoglycan-associated lipoprotein Pal [Pseudomonadota bacterium]